MQLDAVKRDSESRMLHEAKEYEEKLGILQGIVARSENKINDLDEALKCTAELNYSLRHESEESTRKLQESVLEIGYLRETAEQLKVSCPEGRLGYLCVIGLGHCFSPGFSPVPIYGVL